MKKIKLIALAAAAIVALGVYLFLKEAGQPQEIPHTAVVVAAADIPENTKITEDMVMLQSVATEALAPNHMRDPENVIGMVTSGNIYAGEQIASSRLVRMGAEVDESKTLAYKVDDGMRAITIAVNGVTGLSNMIKPGNRVDVIMNYSFEREVEKEEDGRKTPLSEFPIEEEEEEPETETVQATRILVQNVPVLAVGAVLNRDGAEEYSTVTLQVTPEEAVELSFAEFTSSIRVILRSSLDDAIADEYEVELDTIRGTGEEAAK